ncbi:MAG TPA: hypothetical protein VHI95_13555 [Acidimicrobiales bacterium]|nr:hypothetical protein [Acidimicrobiales bacterium]
MPVADTDEQEIAGPHSDALFVLGGDEIVDRHRIARFKPRHVAHTRNVKQYSSPDDPVGDDIDRQCVCARWRDGTRAHVPVQGVVVDDVTKRVDVSVTVAMHVHCDTVHRKMTTGRVDSTVYPVGHFVPNRLRIVCRRRGLHGRSQGDGLAKTNLARGSTHVRGYKVGERAGSFGRSRANLGFEAVIEPGELGAAHLCCAADVRSIAADGRA